MPKVKDLHAAEYWLRLHAELAVQAALEREVSESDAHELDAFASDFQPGLQAFALASAIRSQHAESAAHLIKAQALHRRYLQLGPDHDSPSHKATFGETHA